MKQPAKNNRIIITGGGTGGHIFPAISIANELKRRNKETDILFVGAKGKMEMERVPAAGYKIKGLPVRGLKRKLSIDNIKTGLNLVKSLWLAKKIINEFKPDVVVGVGGYASGPVMRMASKAGVPGLLQEQNSFAGITNKLLAKNASKICVAYENMDRYFPAEKIILSGNPVRDIRISDENRREALKHFDLNTGIPTILIVGGSLGAKTINEAVLKDLERLAKEKIQILWQTGKIYYDTILEQSGQRKHKNIRIYDFISRMDLAYNIADVMISRAGAISISEICLTGRASILVPSPNVAEDHQTKNAMALVEDQAALMIKDREAKHELIPQLLQLIHDKALIEKLSGNSKKLSKPLSTKHIVDEVYKLIEKRMHD